MIKQALVDVESMFELLKSNQEVEDEPGATELSISGRLAPVAFERVVFQYEARAGRGPILNELSFSVGPGQKLALVGGSGAGKSTIARLLYRLYDVDSGRVTIAGTDIKRCTQRSVRLLVGIVPQDCVLFNDTIAYNVGFGALARGKLATDEQVAEAAAAAQLTEFIKTQPQGFGTVVGERGLRLSGGEKLRVRRSHVGAGLPDGEGHPEDDRPRGQGPHEPRHRPPPLDHRRRRRDSGTRGRPRGGAGLTR